MLSDVQLFATPRTAACQAPQSMGFPRQEHWRGLLLPSPKWCWDNCKLILQLDIHMKSMKLSPTSHHAKKYLKMDQRSKCVQDKTLRRKKQKCKSLWPWITQWFLRLNKSTSNQNTMPHTGLIKEHSQEIEKTTEWEETLANYMCNKVLVSKIYLTTTTNKR